MNLRLWAALLLPPFAGGINTVVGYMVSNYDCNVHNRHLVLLVNLFCLMLCGISALLVLKLKQRIETEFDDSSKDLRITRLFLRKLSLWFAAGFALLVVAGSFATMLMGACDL
ncbi:hypothetical protein [Terriglobus sp. RCC_193]|uniref:hypothetical protein n=1 Tax=Terriglobus sp. RCC_193 TaxID=3239218 RepID=UPI003523A7AA